MRPRLHRRRFLKSVTAAGAGYWITGITPAQGPVTSPNEKLNFACIGVGGIGQSHLTNAARFGNVVALCDVDRQRLDAAGVRYPKARKYADFHRMLDDLCKGLDAVIVSTPNHTHAVASVLAMRLGKHCFTEKPLARTVWETRTMAAVAREKNLATQMNIQGTASANLRKAAALIRAGVLGPVSEIHIWSSRPIWPQGVPQPAAQPVPQHLDWDLWLGPASPVGYNSVYHPFGWRAWWAFGTGALGDMGPHALNLPFMALDLRDPTTITAETSGHNQVSFPQWSIVRWDFPARGNRRALKLTWYDGKKLPPPEVLGELAVKPGTSGILIVGAKGKMYCPSDSGASYKLLGDVAEVPVEVAPSPGHFDEWVRAIRDCKPGKAVANFSDYAAPLSETVLLGNLAVWVGGKVEWDARKMQATNVTGLDHLLRPEYRKGWSL
jgi:predicted dehydrogenase